MKAFRGWLKVVAMAMLTLMVISGNIMLINVASTVFNLLAVAIFLAVVIPMIFYTILLFVRWVGKNVVEKYDL